MGDAKPSLAKAIQRQFAPALRRDGFSGTAQRYWRVVGEQAQIVQIQGSRSGGKFAVNLAIHPLVVPMHDGQFADPKHLQEYYCLLRRRLAVQGGDQWWPFEATQASMDEAAQQACVVYEQVGRSQFAAVLAANASLYTVTPEQFAKRQFKFGFGNTLLVMVWGLAHMRKAAGDRVASQGFAKLGLDMIGEGPGGAGLRNDLQALIETA
jgi:hypothetical protein